jgi:hypothetical protein
VAARQLGERELLQVTAGLDAFLRETLGAFRADAPDFAHGQVAQERFDLVWRDGELAVGLAPVAGDFREHFVGGDAGRGGELRFAEDARTDFLGDVPGVAVTGRDVEVGFVEGERFDQRRVVAEDGADFGGLGAVEVEAAREEDEMRAAFARLEAGHGGVDAEFARLVVAGGHHAAPRSAADGDGLAGELGVFAHLDGRIEAVHVEVDDLAHGIFIVAVGVRGRKGEIGLFFDGRTEFDRYPL